MSHLPNVNPLKLLREDLDVVVERDPATRSRLEAALASPGLHALWSHRLAHAVHHLPGGRVPARVISHVSRAITGVEIHPGAQIGRRVVIDHGMGVVIGETATVGDDVLIYHGVTLGARRVEHGLRHPQVGNGVILGTGAAVLGPISVGDGAKIAANAVVTDDVPERGRVHPVDNEVEVRRPRPHVA